METNYLFKLLGKVNFTNLVLLVITFSLYFVGFFWSVAPNRYTVVNILYKTFVKYKLVKESLVKTA